MCVKVEIYDLSKCRISKSGKMWKWQWIVSLNFSRPYWPDELPDLCRSFSIPGLSHVKAVVAGVPELTNADALGVPALGQVHPRDIDFDFYHTAVILKKSYIRNLIKRAPGSESCVKCG